MAIVKGVVEGAHDKWEKWNILVDGKWYNTKLEWAKVKPVVGDEVEFDDGGRNYTKNLRVVAAAGPQFAAKASPKGGGKQWSNVGVEVGHATNIAVQIALTKATEEGDKIGTDEFFRDFVSITDKVYRMTKALREKYDNPDVGVGTAPEPVVEPEATITSTINDETPNSFEDFF